MFERIKLPYSFDALEPHIDAKTMEIHSENHHQAYTDKLNAALDGTEWMDKPIEEILMKLDEVPEDKRMIVRNQGGGFINHNIFFATIGPKAGGEPTGKVADFINEAFGGFKDFKEKFTAAATSLFGSGWVWLALDENGKNAHLASLPNQDNPYMHKHFPLFGIDIWEHAYYLKYQNRRPEYVEAFWNVINWEKVNEMIGKAKM